MNWRLGPQWALNELTFCAHRNHSIFTVVRALHVSDGRHDMRGGFLEPYVYGLEAGMQGRQAGIRETGFARAGCPAALPNARFELRTG